MNQAPEWKIPKWPFLLGNAVLLAVAAVLIYKAAHPISDLQIILAVSAVALGAILGCLPFILDYRAAGKMLEVNALSTVAATSGIADRMVTEIRDFNEFQLKLNDTEKGALRLEVEKLRRTEGEWIQVVARILDHIFALYLAASRSGQPELADQIGHFQNACRDAARRVGLTPFGAEPNDKFDPKRHRAQGVENPADGALVAGLLAPGMTYQGRLIRLALVQLATGNEPVAETSAASIAESAPEKGATPKADQVAETEPDQLSLEPDEV